MMTSEDSNDRPTLLVELVGDERACEPIKTALLALQELSITIVESATGLSLTDPMFSSVDVTMALVEDSGVVNLSRLRARMHDKEATLFALLSHRSSLEMRKALRDGADELLFLPLEPGYVMRALLNISETKRKKLTGRGIICSFFSITGGVGLTTLMGNIGLALRSQMDKCVAFVDLHLQSGDLSTLLDLSPEYSIATLSETKRKIDSTTITSVLTRHDSDAYLLAAPRSIEEGELVTEEAVNAGLQVLRKLFDVVLVDCGSHIDTKTVGVWERSDHLLYVVDQSIRAVKSAGRFVELVNRMGPRIVGPSLVINKYAADHYVRKQYIADAVKLPISAEMPRDVQALERAELSGQDLWQCAPGSHLTKAIEKLARRLAGEGEEVSTERQEPSGSRYLPTKLRSIKSAFANV